jgi:hypothetical protein
MTRSPSPSKRTPPSPYTVVHQSPNSTNQSLGRTMTEGAAFGIGSSVARHTVGSVLDASPLSSTANVSDDCRKYIRMYDNCLCETTLTCQEYMDKIQIHCNDSK